MRHILNICDFIENIEESLKAVKSDENYDFYKVELDKQIQVARAYYGKNPKIMQLVDRIEKEMEAASVIHGRNEVLRFFKKILMCFFNHPKVEKFLADNCNS